MNFMGKSTGGGDSGSSNSSRRKPQQYGGEEGGGGNSLEDEDEEERQNTGQLFPSSSSSSPSSSHHLQQHQQQQPPLFHPQPPYHHPNPHPGGGGWMHGGEASAPATDGNNTNDDEEQSREGMTMMMVEREHMFDKVVTPSDVGKLNRLVIPKQHAERYFPLDSSSNDKGLLLNFEDRIGKAWRFRYSYWNSSQSYVMTKGWSRFVKDKKLDAGDIVSFQRGVGGSAKDRLFIDWRHRPDAPAPPFSFPLPHNQFSFNRNNSYHPWNPLFLQSQPAPSRSHSSLMFQPSSYRYGNNTHTRGRPYHSIGTGSVVNVNQGAGSGSSVIYFRSGGGGGGYPQQQVDMMQMHQTSGVGIGIGIGTGMGMGMGMDPPALPPPLPRSPPSAVVFESVPVVHGKAAAKRLRLFGVNMDCPVSDDEDQDFDPASELPPGIASSTNIAIPMGDYHHDQFQHYHHHHPPPSTPSSSTIPYQQLRPYDEEETQFNQATMMSSTSDDHAFNKTTKSSSSSRMSLDFDI